MTAWPAGVVAALEAQGLAGSVPVTGQDGDKAALNRVALGTQLVSVWKDSRVLGKMAAEAAVALADGAAMDSLPGVAKFSGGKNGVEMNSILIAPNPITKDNLGDVITAGWITKEEACAGVAGRPSPPATRSAGAKSEIMEPRHPLGGAAFC